MKKAFVIIVIFLWHTTISIAQTTDPPDLSWDNWLIVGNKIVFGGHKSFKHSHEIQFRIDNNLHSLNTFLYEAVGTYSPNIHWEMVADIRFSRKATRDEYRPGFGIIRKDYLGSNGITQLAQTVKWQADIRSDGGYTQAMRYAPFISHLVNDKIIVGGLAAAVYQWGPDFPGRIAFVRFGPSFGVIFDKVHTLSILPAFGAENYGESGWAWSFTPVVQLIIRVRKDYKYLPARYINF